MESENESVNSFWEACTDFVEIFESNESDGDDFIEEKLALAGARVYSRFKRMMKTMGLPECVDRPGGGAELVVRPYVRKGPRFKKGR